MFGSGCAGIMQAILLEETWTSRNVDADHAVNKVVDDRKSHDKVPFDTL